MLHIHVHPKSHLVFLLPQVVQSNVLHCTVSTKLAAKHFLEHVEEVHMMLRVHCIVVVKVQKNYLNHSDIIQLEEVQIKSIYGCAF